ncbi:response regulator transcription factor [Nocardioides sp.]|nr:response regulator transcription factor [Nocardioides sp.]
MRVLVVEDDEGVGEALVETFTTAGWETTLCRRGDDGLRRVKDVDVVLLDLGLPDIDGLEFLHVLRRASTVPVLVLTARDGDGAMILGLRAGADDYLVKPVSQAVLLARVQALIRRSRVAGDQRPRPPQQSLSWGRLVVDLPARTVTREGRPVALTATEIDVLTAIASRPGEAVSREEIQLQVWGAPEVGRSRSLDFFVASLRSKLGEDLPLHTVRGFGFRLGR